MDQEKSGQARVLGVKIKELREKQNLSQLDLAKAAEISRVYLSEIETGKSNPSLEILGRISFQLGVSIAELRAGKAMSIDIPSSLQLFAKQKALAYEDVIELINIRFRGRTPSTLEDWEEVYSLWQQVLYWKNK